MLKASFKLFAIFVMLLPTSCTQDPNLEIEVCVSRGVQYFKEIGSYPTLGSKPDAGRKAEDVARERCNRSTMAFRKSS